MIKKIAIGTVLSIGLGVFLAWLYRSDLGPDLGESSDNFNHYS